MRNVFGDHAWSIEEESIAQLPIGTFSVGIGRDLLKQSGLSDQSIMLAMEQVIGHLVDGGACFGFIDETKCYFMRRGKAIEAGTRMDFEELDWADICDVCDSTAQGAE